MGTRCGGSLLVSAAVVSTALLVDKVRRAWAMNGHISIAFEMLLAFLATSLTENCDKYRHLSNILELFDPCMFLFKI